MKPLPRTLLIALLFVLTTAALAHAEPAAYIVTLRQDSGAVHAARARAAGTSLSETELESYRASLRAAQDAFLAHLTSAGVFFSVASAPVPGFDGAKTSVPLRTTLVLNSVTLLLEPEAAAQLASRPEVRRVERARRLALQLDRSVAYIRAPQVYGTVPELGPFDDAREGYEGQGIKIAVIDTGIEWSHEMFGGDPTPPRHGLAPLTAAASSNQKVIYYISFLENLIDDFGHGTHVSADAAGYRGFSPGADGVPNTADDVPVHGVAPQARLMGYKVCDGVLSASTVVGGCLTPLTVLALEDAVSPRTLTGFPKPVADVINLSLGGSGGPDDSTAEAASGAALLGAVVVAAAGNEGPGERTLGSPAAGRHVLAAAASNDPGVFTNTADVLENGAPRPGTPRMLAFWAPDSNLKSNISQPIVAHYVFAGLADTPDQVPATVAGNICLVERGSTVSAGDQGSGLFANKAAQCTLKGAIAVVAFNNVPGELEGVLAPAAIPVFTISRENGLYLRDQLGFDALGLSRFELRINPEDPASFAPGIAGFSSRGPVQGKGQVKPDVSAPGVAILSATTLVGVPVTSMQSATRYTSANGTSFASPITSGAVALVRQAHPDWSPAEIRTALINTATNPRSAAGAPLADGGASPDVLSQGGGLIDVAAAVHAPALLGVAGDGVVEPEILGSHSFGEVPVANSRVSHSENVVVTLRDVSGQGGSYTFSAADNRGLDQGASVTFSPAGASLPAGGESQVTVTLTIDGNVLRQPAEVQWFVVARAADGTTLRMPCYLDATRSVPSTTVTSRTETYTGLVPAGDTGLGAAADVTYVDVPFPAGDATYRINGHLDFGVLVDGTYPDLDLILFDPNGVELARSAEAGGPENLSALATVTGTYVYRVSGWAGAAIDFTITSTQDLGGEPPAVAPIAGEWINAAGQRLDFDGAYSLSWTSLGGEQRFEVEASTDGGASWTALGPPAPADQTSLSFTDQPNGRYLYRVRSFFPGRIGYFVTAPSAAVEVVVDRRTRAMITKEVSTPISNVALANGVFRLDLALTSKSSSVYVPLVDAQIINIQSPSGEVHVTNADNGGDGRPHMIPAAFSYSNKLGADEAFTPGETTGTRTLQFADPASELFTFDVIVYAHQGTGPVEVAGGSASGTSAAANTAPPHSTSPLQLLRFTVDARLRLVTVKLLGAIF